MQPGDRFIAEVVDFAYHQGSGVAKVNGFVVFIPWAIPGDIVEASIKDIKANFGFAELIEVKKPSGKRVSPLCPVFTICGGCALQNLAYKDQLSLKDGYVINSFKRIAHLDLSNVEMNPIIESPESWFYRNKMEFVFDSIDGKPILGLHEKGSYKKYVNVQKCFIFSELAPGIMEAIRNLVKRNNLTTYNPVTHRGFLRHLVMREAKSTGKMLVNLVTDYGEINKKEIADIMPEYVSSLVWTLNTRRADAVIPEKEILIKGSKEILDKIGDIYFSITPNSFVQPNPYAANVMYKKIREILQLKGNEIILDLYCGSGGIGLHIAKDAKRLFGIDSSRISIDAAERNAHLNNINNIQFINDDVRRALYHRKGWRKKIDIAIIDPPRDGVSKRAMRHLIYLQPLQILYVSCNPTTLARDSSILLESGYDLKCVQPIDMFPQTYHVEVIASFSLC